MYQINFSVGQILTKKGKKIKKAGSLRHRLGLFTGIKLFKNDCSLFLVVFLSNRLDVFLPLAF